MKVYRYAFLCLSILHLHKSCIFNMRFKKKSILQKVQGFCACWHSCSKGFMNFLFSKNKKTNNGPFTAFIYLEMAGDHSCRPQSMVPVKQFNFFWQCHDLSLLLENTSWSLVARHIGPMVVFIVYSIALKLMRSTWELLEITCYYGMQFTGGINCSYGDD